MICTNWKQLFVSLWRGKHSLFSSKEKTAPKHLLTQIPDPSAVVILMQTVQLCSLGSQKKKKMALFASSSDLSPHTAAVLSVIILVSWSIQYFTFVSKGQTLTEANMSVLTFRSWGEIQLNMQWCGSTSGYGTLLLWYLVINCDAVFSRKGEPCVGR